MLAAQTDSSDMIRVAMLEDSITTLFSALASQNRDRIQSLLHVYPHLVNASDDSGTTPLMYATEYDRAFADLLIQNGANVKANDHHGLTAIHWAVYWDNADVLDALLTVGGDPNDFADLSEMEIVRAEADLKIGCFDNTRLDLTRWTPLHMAALSGSLKLVQLLVRAGADPTAQTTDGFCPLNFADIRSYPDKAVVLQRAFAFKKLTSN